MYDQSAALYDLLYDFKDYEAEARHVRHLIQEHRRIDCRTLLDVACGTGRHLAHLRADYEVAGLDLDGGLLEVARQRLPEATFYQGDMRDFGLDRTFDAITCLFGAIAYVQTLEGLQAALLTFARHLQPGGVLVLEPFHPPEAITPGKLHSLYHDGPEIKIARFSRSTVEGNLMTATFHYLVGSDEGIETFSETHRLGLFTRAETLDALGQAGFVGVESPSIDAFKRGIIVGVRSPV